MSASITFAGLERCASPPGEYAGAAAADKGAARRAQGNRVKKFVTKG
jgi:hypothetical protein